MPPHSSRGSMAQDSRRGLGPAGEHSSDFRNDLTFPPHSSAHFEDSWLNLPPGDDLDVNVRDQPAPLPSPSPGFASLAPAAGHGLNNTTSSYFPTTPWTQNHEESLVSAGEHLSGFGDNFELPPYFSSSSVPLPPGSDSVPVDGFSPLPWGAAEMQIQSTAGNRAPSPQPPACSTAQDARLDLSPAGQYFGSSTRGGATNAPGGGPPPATSFDGQVSSPPSGPTSEFTKTKSWASDILENVKDILLVVDADSRIVYLSPSIGPLAGYTPEKVLGKNLSDLIHPDDKGVTAADLNEAMATGNRFRVFFRLKKSDESWETVEAVGHAHIAAPRFASNPENQSAFCQAIIMMLRPYPSKADRLFDSFLETKIKNKRFARWLAELNSEDAEIEASEAEEGDEAEAPRDARKRGHSNISGRPASVGSIPLPERRTKGDLDLDLPIHRDSQESSKRRKTNIQEEFVCAECGTTESPEWRKGPGGSKTLCNACGIRWIKEQKKAKASGGGSSADAPQAGYQG